MVRHRWTLALILISVPILATVITAFRVRDLPRSSSDGKVTKKQYKCDTCGVNELDLDQFHSFKIESVKRSSEDVKKSVRDKQTLISDKATTNDDDDDDEDDDDDDDKDSESKLKLIKAGGVKSQDNLKKNLVKNEKLEEKKKKLTDDEDEDDDDDDDDENDDDDEDDDDDIKKDVPKRTSAEKIKISNVKKKDSPVTFNLIKSTEKKDNSDDDDDDDDETDDDDDDDDDEDDDDDDDNEDDSKTSKKVNFKVNLKSKVEQPSVGDVKKKVVVSTQSKSASVDTRKKGARNDDDDKDDDEDDDDDDDDEDDDDNDNEEDDVDKKKKSVTDKKSEVKLGEIHKKDKSKDRDGDDDDDDDDDDYDDDDDDDDEDSIDDSKKKGLPTTPKSVKKVVMSSKETPQVKDRKKPKIDEEKISSKKDKTDESISKVKSKPHAKPEIKVSVVVKKELDSFFEGEDVKKEPIKKTKQDSGKKDEKLKKEPAKAVKEDTSKVTKKDAKVHTETKKSVEKSRKKEAATPKNVADILQEKIVKTESYIKQVSEALHRKNLLQSEFEDFYAFFPTFAPNFSRIANPECRRHGQILLRQLRGTKLWALNMLDATAKIPSGILQGNGIQLGDFDQCLGSRARVQLDTGSVVKVQGKYCLARLEVKAEHPELEAPVHLAQAKNLFNSRIDDPGHFVPRFSTLSWGVCVPAPCHSEDVEAILKDAVKHYQHKIGLAVRVKVDDIDCHTRQSGKWWDKWMEIPTLVTLAFYGVIVLIVIVATVMDYLNKKETEAEGDGGKSEDDEAKEVGNEEAKEQEESGETTKKSGGILSSFSLYRTIGKLISPAKPDEISCIHGVRAISTIALLVAHKFLPTGVTPYTNRLDITEIVSNPIWSWSRAGWIFTDSFLLLSGALKAHRVSLVDIVVSRYIRLAPALLAVTLFYAYIWDNISQGPMWGTLVTKNAEICQEGWWWNMLFIQNHFKMEEICAPQTHQLALDMQLSIFGWLIVLLTKSESLLSRTLVPSVHLVAAYLRYSTVRDHRLSMIAYHGMTVSQIYRTARLSYMSVLHRCSPYLIGLSLGAALRNPGRHGKLFLALGWLVSSSLWGLVLWAGHDAGFTEYRYNITFAAQYAALAPIASAIGLAWIIYVVHGGYCGFLSNILCCRPLLFISRLSYAIYLIQFLVYFTKAATVKTSSEFTLLSLIDGQEILTLLISAIILTVTFVIPMQSLYRESSSEQKGDEEEEELKENVETSEGQEEPEAENKEVEEEVEDAPPVRKTSFVAHREVLEEIPEVEVEYETQRDINDGLEEILEEEEEDSLNDHLEDDLEIIEEEQEQEEMGGEEDYWAERREYIRRRSYLRNSDQDLDEWAVTNGHGRNGAQHYRYSR